MGVIAGLIYVVIPAALAVGFLYLVFRMFFQKLSDKEAAEKQQSELRKRLEEEFPDPIEKDLKGELSAEEIDRSISELKQDK